MRLRFFVAAAAMLSASLAAHADTFDFSFGTAANTFSGSGVLTGNLISPDEYQIIGVTGTTNTGTNRTISNILAPGAFPTLTNGGTPPSNDNLLFVSASGVGSFDEGGLSYELGNGAQINLFNQFDELLERAGGVLVTEDVPITITAVTSVTPEPSTFLLLTTGLLGMAGVIRKRFA